MWKNKNKEKHDFFFLFCFLRIYLNAGNIKLNGYHISWYSIMQKKKIYIRNEKKMDEKLCRRKTFT
jgi:hypothetical protein